MRFALQLVGASAEGPPDALDVMRISRNEDFIANLKPDGHD
jgi:hypothetical protein